MKLNSLSDLARLSSGAGADPEPSFASTEPFRHNGKGRTVRISMETKGRKGKIVTLISGLHHNPTTLQDLARELKQHCGAGGSVKNGTIEIQGDQRSRVAKRMGELGYRVTG
ncbi:MAG TPA: translation initiation factor [Bacteroidota bacterium]|nr:translation initiation factor [Bacteroidota bacterium]